jgi:hypothetical protein
MSNSDLDPVFERFKPIRDKLRQLNAFQFINVCFNRLAFSDTRIREKTIGPESVDVFVYSPPWEILLLMKWILRYGKGGLTGNQITHKEFEDLREELGYCYSAKLPGSDNGWFLNLRRYTHQFPYQLPMHRSHIARQSLIFGKLEGDHDLRQAFENLTGIDMNLFIGLEFATVGLVYAKPQTRLLNLDTFMNLKYPGVSVSKFLETISSGLNGMRDSILETDKNFEPVIIYELYEPSPFIKFPLLRIEGGFYCYSQLLLLINFQNAIYDTLRSSGAEVFMRYFGDIFESYVQMGVRHSRLDYITEKQLKAQLGEKRGRGFVDFILYDSDTMVLVDAKGVEMQYMGKVSEDPVEVAKHIQASVLKGFKQAFSLVNAMSNIEPCPVRNLREKFLLIVTFKDLYLGNGSDVYSYIAKNEIDKIVTNYGGSFLIPMENIYILSVEDFDLLMNVVHLGRMGLAECLNYARTMDASISTKKLVFRQHLLELFHEITPPDYLNDEFLALTKRL